jgi:hypothetical protein
VPIQSCTLPGGGSGFRWGGSGKCYPTRAQAEAQARAAYSAGYREKVDMGALLNPVLKYSEDQPRDDAGRWTDEGGVGGGASTSEAPVDHRAHMAAQLRASNRLMQMARDAAAAGDEAKARELRTQSHERHALAMEHQAKFLAQEKAKETARRRAETRARNAAGKADIGELLKASLVGRRTAIRRGVGLLALLKLQSPDTAAHEAATSPLNLRPQPTPAQASAGNYKKGHTSVAGIPITIENPAGSRRRPEWAPMTAHYGYIKRTEGADGDHVDVFVRPGTANDWVGDVYVINQVTPDGAFDEHKAMVGWTDERSAVRDYAANYERGWRVGPVTSMSSGQFRTWVREGDHKRPV